MAFHSIEQIVGECESKGMSFYEAVIKDSCHDMDESEDALISRMSDMWSVMKGASDTYDRDLKSRSGFVGGAGGMMEDYIRSGEGYCGEFFLTSIAEALKMGESNACMKRIVAAPTAGSCGVMPSVLIAVRKIHHVSDEDIVKSMFVAAGIGSVIAHRASIAGATGGCQAEIGSAAAMTAGALVYLRNGTVRQISSAVSMTLKNMMGLICDPVGGLVEIPCVKRNVAGAANAITCAEMALAGIESMIPADQVIDAMKEVGDDMNSKYKETACGGCAATPEGLRLAENLCGF